MLRFIDYLTLLESKVDDLEQQNPNIPVRQYADVDNTPTKKFLPWLVKQHKLGNVTPDHPDLINTLNNFDKYKSKHGITDHTQHSFQEVADAVKPHIGTAATNKEKQKQEVDSGVEVIHKEPNGITAQHIKTKEASQNMYGGGNERGGPKGGARGTTWCVSARSEGCLFQYPTYGKMYTIHDPNDDYAPYAVHPETKTITSRFNDGDNPINKVLKEKPHLSTAVAKIQAHYIKNQTPEEEILHKFKNNPNDITEDDIDKYIKHPDANIRNAAINHPKSNSKHIDYVLANENEKTDPDSKIRISTVYNPSFNANHLEHIIKNENNITDAGGYIRRAAIYHDKVTEDHITHVLTNENEKSDTDGSIRTAAMNHYNVNADHITHVLTHENEKSDPDGYIRKTAIGHHKATADHITHVLTHENEKSDPDGSIRRKAIDHHKFDTYHITHVLNHENEKSDPNGSIRRTAIDHYKVNADHITHVLTHEDEKSDPRGDIRRAAIMKNTVTEDHITHVLTHENEKSDPVGLIREMAINHRKATADHLNHVLTHENNQSDPGGYLRNLAKTKLSKINRGYYD